METEVEGSTRLGRHGSAGCSWGGPGTTAPMAWGWGGGETMSSGGGGEMMSYLRGGVMMSCLVGGQRWCHPLGEGER